MCVFSLVYNNTAAGNHRILSEFGRNIVLFLFNWMGVSGILFFIRWLVGLFLLQSICIQLIWNSKGGRT